MLYCFTIVIQTFVRAHCLESSKKLGQELHCGFGGSWMGSMLWLMATPTEIRPNASLHAQSVRNEEGTVRQTLGIRMLNQEYLYRSFPKLGVPFGGRQCKLSYFGVCIGFRLFWETIPMEVQATNPECT